MIYGTKFAIDLLDTSKGGKGGNVINISSVAGMYITLYNILLKISRNIRPCKHSIFNFYLHHAGAMYVSLHYLAATPMITKL